MAAHALADETILSASPTIYSDFPSYIVTIIINL